MQYYIDWVIWHGVFLLCGMFIFNINNTAFLITKIHSFDKSWQLVSIYNFCFLKLCSNRLVNRNVLKSLIMINVLPESPNNTSVCTKVI